MSYYVINEMKGKELNFPLMVNLLPHHLLYLVRSIYSRMLIFSLFNKFNVMFAITHKNSTGHEKSHPRMACLLCLVAYALLFKFYCFRFAIFCYRWLLFSSSI